MIDNVSQKMFAYENDFTFENIVGRWIREPYNMQLLKNICTINTTVLITGESGVGKGALAKMIVKNSDRKDKSFVDINCGAIAENLLESQLFGHVKGAFTSADKDHVGFFEEAHNGTIFLDEITETSQLFQIKLLKVLDNRKIRKLGGSRDIPIDVRILVATNKDISTEVKKGNFRLDLFHRLSIVEIKIPPLRERIDDIPFLVDYYIKKIGVKYKKHIFKIDPKTLEILRNHYWHGNIRELINAIEYAIIMESTDTLLPQNLPGYIHRAVNTSQNFSKCTDITKVEQTDIIQKEQAQEYFNDTEMSSNENYDLPYADAKDYFEKRYFNYLLEKFKGNVSKLAKISKIGRKTIYRKLKKLGIHVDLFKYM